MLDHYLYLAWQRCRKLPATSALIMLTLAIGIAACLTALTIFSAFEGEPIPGVSSHLYVATFTANSNSDADGRSSGYPDSLLTLHDAKALVDANRARAQVAVVASHPQVSLSNGRDQQTTNALLAYGQVLQVLGVNLRFGRTWSAQELHTHAPVALIDTHLAKRLFGTANAVGRSVRLGHQLFRVIGVTAPWQPRMRFSRVEQAFGEVLGRPMHLFIPVGAALDAGVGPVSSGECGNSAANTMYGSVDVAHCRWLETWVALNSPSAVTDYNNFLRHYAEAQHAAGHFQQALQAQLFSMRAWMTQNGFIPDDVSLDAILAGAFLLLCMTNVIGLMTARFLDGRSDASIRRALGATRRDLMSQHLVESTLLGLAGGLLALPLTWVGMWVVRQQPVGYAPAAHFSPWAFVGLALLSLIVGALVGLWPAWRICRLPPALRIKQA